MMKKKMKYKETGIAWMPQIPEHWDVVRLKSIVPSLQSGVWGNDPKEDKNDIYCIRVADFDRWNYGISEEKLTIRNIEEKEQEGRLLHLKDLIIEKSGGGDISPVGRVVFYNLDKKAVSSNFIARLIIGTDINREYLYYIFRTLYNGRLNIPSIKATTGIQNLDLYSYFQNKIPLPPLVEQADLVTYIKAKTEKINLFIRKKQQLIELLKEKRQGIINEAVTKGVTPNVKMKASGIEWIGDVPEHWELWKVNRAFKIIGSGTTPDSGNSTYYDNGTINWINTGDLNDSILESCEKKITQIAFDAFSTLRIYPKGTIIIAMYGATIGKTSLLNIEGCTNQACCALTNSDVFVNEFVFYWFISNKKNLIRFSYGGGQPNISQDVIRQLRIPSPPLSEQRQIVSRIKAETAVIDIAITKAEKEIGLVKEYKESMILEAVTGKIVNLQKK